MKDTARKCNVKSGNNIVTFSCELPPDKIDPLIGSGGDHIMQIRSKKGVQSLCRTSLKKGETDTDSQGSSAERLSRTCIVDEEVSGDRTARDVGLPSPD